MKLPAENLLDVLLFLERSHLDTLSLTTSSFGGFISDKLRGRCLRFLTHLHIDGVQNPGEQLYYVFALLPGGEAKHFHTQNADELLAYLRLLIPNVHATTFRIRYCVPEAVYHCLQVIRRQCTIGILERKVELRHCCRKS